MMSASTTDRRGGGGSFFTRCNPPHFTWRKTYIGATITLSMGHYLEKIKIASFELLDTVQF